MDWLVSDAYDRYQSYRKTLGFIAVERITQAMARKAHHGFGINILFADP